MYKPGTVRIWNVADRKVAVEFASGLEELNVIAWDPRLPRIAIPDNNNSIHLWNTDGTVVTGWERENRSIRELAWNPVYNELASVAQDGKLRVWHLNGEPDGIFTTGELMNAVAWKPDGSQLASGSESGAVQLWRRDGRPCALLKGHVDRATSVAWSTDGRWIASGSRDNTVRIWSAEGKEIAVLRGHVGQIGSVRWRPHSSRLLSGSSDGTIRLWNVDSDHPEWIYVPLRDKQSVRFDSTGRLLSGDQDVFEREFAFVVEQPTGAMKVLAPSEFQRRIKLAQ